VAGPTLSPTEFAAAVTAITSAFGDPTRREIYLYAHANDAGVTAAEVAGHFALHPNVARHHLDKLTGGGYLEVSTDRVTTGGAGRPSKRYRAATDHAALQLTPRHDDLVATLLGRALELLPPAQAAAMAEEVGVDYGRAMAGAMGGAASTRSLRAALTVVADALTAHGFAAHAEAGPRSNGALRIVSENCPFGGAAIANPVICAVDRGMVKGLLQTLYGDTSPATEASVAMGDAVCVTAVDCS
jgi:predicted ArsR family transcriptional regulator